MAILDAEHSTRIKLWEEFRQRACFFKSHNWFGKSERGDHAWCSASPCTSELHCFFRLDHTVYQEPSILWQPLRTRRRTLATSILHGRPPRWTNLKDGAYAQTMPLCILKLSVRCPNHPLFHLMQCSKICRERQNIRNGRAPMIVPSTQQCMHANVFAYIYVRTVFSCTYILVYDKAPFVQNIPVVVINLHFCLYLFLSN